MATIDCTWVPGADTCCSCTSPTCDRCHCPRRAAANARGCTEFCCCGLCVPPTPATPDPRDAEIAAWRAWLGRVVTERMTDEQAREHIARRLWDAGARDAEIERLRDALRTVLKSAHPRKSEHPTMHDAWRKAEKVLGITRAESTAIAYAGEPYDPPEGY